MAKNTTIAVTALLAGAIALPASGAGRITAPGTDSASSIEILSWSWGMSNSNSSSSPRRTASPEVCNPCTAPADAAASSAPQPGPTISGSTVTTAREAGSGMATGRRQHQPMPVRATSGDCDDTCDSTIAPTGAFSSLTRQASVDRFTVSVANLPATLARFCTTPDAPQTLSLAMDGENYELSIVKVQGCPSAGRSGDMPNRISMNMSRQGAPACSSGACTADAVQLTFTGSMKHTKTGHVTLMK